MMMSEELRIKNDRGVLNPNARPGKRSDKFTWKDGDLKVFKDDVEMRLWVKQHHGTLRNHKV